VKKGTRPTSNHERLKRNTVPVKGVFQTGIEAAKETGFPGMLAIAAAARSRRQRFEVEKGPKCKVCLHCGGDSFLPWPRNSLILWTMASKISATSFGVSRFDAMSGLNTAKVSDKFAKKVLTRLYFLLKDIQYVTWNNV
jgi:hypothetical protein